MITKIFATESELATSLARHVATAIASNPRIVLGFPTGRTPLALYDALAEITAREGLDWSQVRTFNLDEFVGLSGGNPASYRAFMEARLFSRVGIRAGHVGFLDGMAADLQAESARYERAIADAGGIDLQILGIGVNGHIGFNEPGDALHGRTHRVRLLDRSRASNAMWFGGDVSKVPAEALSMGMATILAAREIVLMATGDDKAPAVKEMLEGPLTTRLPASFLQLHRNASILLDREAASLTSACGRAVP